MTSAVPRIGSFSPPPRGSAIRAALRLAGVWLLLLASAGPMASPGAARGAEGIDGPPPGPTLLRRAYVPADRPEVWPRGRWTTLTTDAFRQLQQDLAESDVLPPSAFLSRVEYAATLQGTTLVDGTLTANCHLQVPGPAYLPLDDTSLPLNSLDWPDGPAIWGTTPSGQAVLRVESHRHELRGEWSLTGRTDFGELEFAARLLPASISRVRVTAHRGLRLEADGALLSVRDLGADGRLWTLDLGGRTDLQLRVIPSPGPNEPPRPLCEQAAVFSVRPDGAQVQWDLTLLSPTTAPPELTFLIPPTIEISGVTLGNETELPSSLVRTERQNRLTVRLADVELTGRLPLRLQGTVAIGRGRAWRVPRLVLRGGQTHASRTSVVIQQPLELKDFTHEGCVLLSSSLDRNGADVLHFEDTSASPELSLTFDIPRSDVTASTVSLVARQGTDRLLRTNLRLSTQTGSTYAVTCRVPREWQVTKVAARTPSSPSALAQWRTTIEGDGLTTLLVELRDALVPGETAVVEVWARPLAPQSPDRLDIPAVLPLRTSLRNVLVILEPPDGMRIEVPTDSSYVVQDGGDIAVEELAASGLTEALDLLDDGRTVVLQASGPNVGDRLELVRLPEPSRSARGTTARDVTTDMPRPAADVHVTTLVAGPGHADCLHSVTYDVRRESLGQPLQLVLPPGAALVEALVQGRDEFVAIDADRRQIELLEGWEAGPVTIRYRSPLRKSLWGISADVPLPHSPLLVTSLSWELVVPTSCRVAAGTTGVSASDVTPIATWRERWLGPLAAWRGMDPWTFVPGAARSNVPREDTLPLTTESRSVAFSATRLTLRLWDLEILRRGGWLAFASACLLGMVCRRSLGHTGAETVTVLLLVSFLLPLVLSDPWAVLGGGWLWGLVITTALPRRLWSLPGPASGHARSALSHGASVSAATATLLVAISLCGGAPPASEMDFDSLDEAAARVDVLIPSRQPAEGSADGPVVYLRPEVLEAWTAARAAVSTPPTLIRQAEYHLDLTSEGPVGVRAVFDVILTRPAASHVVELPLSGLLVKGRTCVVNGRTTPLLPMSGGEGLVVIADASHLPPLPESPDELEPAETFEPTGEPSRSTATDTVLRIEIEAEAPHPPVPGRLVEFHVPRVLSSRVQVTSAAPVSDAWILQGANAVLTATRDLLSIGRVSELIVEHAASPRPTADSRMSPESAVTTVEVHPLRLSCRSWLRYVVDPRSAGETPLALSIALPAETVLRDVHAPGLRAFRVRRATEASTRLDLQLAMDRIATAAGTGTTTDTSTPAGASTAPGQATETEPPGRLTVELEFELPAQSRGGRSVLPALPFTSGTPGEPQFRVRKLGLTATGGFRIEPMTHDLAGANQLSPQQFRQSWPDGALLGRVDLAYALTTNQPLSIPLMAVTLTRQAAAEQTLRIGRSLTEWQAELTVDQRGQPSVRQLLEVDARVQIRSVRVIQDGADRLERWSRPSASTLTLLLTEPLSGPHRIEVTGVLTVSPGEVVPRPRLAIADTQLSAETLTVRNESPWTVCLQHGDAVMQTLFPNSQIGQTDRSTARFQADVGSLPSHLQLVPPDPPVPAELVTVLNPLAIGEWQMSAVLRPQGPAPLPETVALIVPDGIVDQLTVLPAGSEVTRTVLGSGRVQLTIAVAASPDGLGEIGLQSRVMTSADATWQLPQLAVHGPLAITHRLMLPRELDYEVAGGDARPLADPRDASGLLRDVTGMTGRRYRHYSSQTGNWELLPRHLAGAPAYIERLQSVVWEDRARGTVGITHLGLAVRRARELTIDVPPRTEVQFMTCNGLPVAVGSSPRLSIPIAEGASAADVRIGWTSPRIERAGFRIFELPRPIGTPVTEHVLAILEADATFVLPARHADAALPSLEWLPFGSDRLPDPLLRSFWAAGYLAESSGTERLNVPGSNLTLRALPSGDAAIRITSIRETTLRSVSAALLLVVILSAFVVLRRRVDVSRLASGFDRFPLLGPCLIGLTWTCLGLPLPGLLLTAICGGLWGLSAWRASRVAHARTSL